MCVCVWRGWFSSASPCGRQHRRSFRLSYILHCISSLRSQHILQSPPIMCFCYIHSPSFRRSSYILEQSKVRVCCPIFLGRQPCVNVTIILIIHDCRQLFSPVAADDGNLLKTKRNWKQKNRESSFIRWCGTVCLVDSLSLLPPVVCFVSFDSALMIQAPKFQPVRSASLQMNGDGPGEKENKKVVPVVLVCAVAPWNVHFRDDDSLAVDHFQNYHCAQQEQQQQEPEGEEEARPTTVVL
jgi:hypothetical protein